MTNIHRPVRKHFHAKNIYNKGKSFYDASKKSEPDLS